MRTVANQSTARLLSSGSPVVGEPKEGPKGGVQPLPLRVLSKAVKNQVGPGKDKQGIGR